jgi:hypothetical protein
MAFMEKLPQLAGMGREPRDVLFATGGVPVLLPEFDLTADEIQKIFRADRRYRNFLEEQLEEGSFATFPAAALLEMNGFQLHNVSPSDALIRNSAFADSM